MSQKPLKNYRRQIEHFTDELLADYVRDLRSWGQFQPKEVNDPVWQTIPFSPFEVIFIDSPLIQRLRRIRQLGVAHWVYPGAMHTRFEHSLGVVHQVQCLASSFNYRAPDGKAVIEEEWVNFLRLAALCHDVGHGMMSHVSENAFAGRDDLEDLTMAFADEHGLERAKPSEMAAVYMFGSAEFGKLVGVAKQRHSGHKLPTDVIGCLKKVVVGQVIHNRLPLLQELISGPFDADKLDYMLRDAKMAGVPGVTDVSRIVQKVRSRELSKQELPEEIAKRVDGNLPSYVMTGLALSGGRSLDELMLGRTLLFDKVYRHQKVRATEHMVGAILRNLSVAWGIQPLVLPYFIDDDDLLHLPETSLQEVAKRRGNSPKKVAAAIALDLGKRLSERRLFARAFAFAQGMPMDPYRTDSVQRKGMELLLRSCALNSPERGRLVTGIAEAGEVAVKLLKREKLFDAIPGKSLVPYVAISPPESPTGGNEIMRAYLIATDGKLVKFKEDSAETRGWADAYLLTNDIGYVFTLKEFAPFVYLAAERLFRMPPYNVRIPATMMSYAKQDREEIEGLRVQLAARGFYEGCPSDLKPVPKRLRRADVDGVLEKILEITGRFDGVSSEEDAKEAKVGGQPSRERVLDWCGQFEEEKMVDAALRVLRHIRVIGRAEIVSALKKLFGVDAAFKDASLCALGEAKDSGRVVTYYSADIRGTANVDINGLEHAVDGDKPIILADDFLGSGKQVITILENMLGLPQTHDLGEVRRAKMTVRQIDAFKKRRLAFVFSAGLDGGVKRLGDFIHEHALNASVVVGVPGGDLPTIDGAGIFENGNQRTAFCKLCKKVGSALLLNPAEGHDAAWAKERALGYGNHGLLVIFPYNTPSHTLTCLWSGGTFNRVRWTPLFLRRKKE